MAVEPIFGAELSEAQLAGGRCWVIDEFVGELLLEVAIRIVIDQIQVSGRKLRAMLASVPRIKYPNTLKLQSKKG